MCFSFEISLLTGLFSWSVGLYLLTKNLTLKQKNNVIFLLILSSMQFADAILWYIKMKKNNINYFITSFIIPVILSLQVLFNVYYRNNNTNIFIHIATIIGILYLFIKFNGYSISSCKNKLSSPIWGSDEISFLEIMIFSLFIFYPNYSNLIGVALMILFIKIFFGVAYGSLWCALANIIAIKYLLTY